MLTSIRLRNLRSIRDSGDIRLRKITLLVGANSSGKSTLLRFLPLLRQSVETNTQAPLLWYGRLVDFGSFREAIHTSAPANDRSTNATNPSPSIAVEFHFRIDQEANLIYFGRTVRLPASLENVTALLELTSDGIETRAARCVLRFASSDVVIEFGPNDRLSSMAVNGRDVLPLLTSRKNAPIPRYASGSFIPAVFPTLEYRRAGTDHALYQACQDRVSELLRNFVARSMSANHLDELSRRVLGLPYHDSGPFRAGLSQLHRSQQWRESVARHLPIVEDIRRMAIARASPSLVGIANAEIEAAGLSVTYVQPFRAAPERYYRFQELAVDEIDSKGTNLAMFLRSLRPKDLRALSAWCKKHFNVEVATEERGGHVVLTITDEHGKANNLADTGFGLSQVLPIVAHVWQAAPMRARRASRSRHIHQFMDEVPVILAMEQPELHLHPRHQASIADMLVEVSQHEATDHPGAKFVLETHSEAIIRRIGEHVQLGNIRAEDVAIYLFEKSNETGESLIRSSSFDEEGVLQNWPIGFFLAEPLWSASPSK